MENETKLKWETMKILMLHDCAGVALNLRRYLKQRGFNVDLYYFAKESDPYIQAYDKCIVRKEGNECAFFVFKKILAGYDIIHTYNTRFPNHPIPYDYVLAKIRRKKVVIHFHGSDLRLRSNHLVTKMLFTNKTLLVSTPDLLQYCPKRAIWLPNPVEPKLFKFVPPDSGHESIRILHSDTTPKGIKTWDWQKGTEHLVRSVNELREKGYKVELLLVGKGVGNVVPITKMPELYAWSDIVVNEVLLPIHSLVGIEGMVCGRPVLSSYNPKFSDAPIIRITPKTLTEKLIELIESPRLREELGRKGRAWAMKHHEPNKVVDKLVKIYEEA